MISDKEAAVLSVKILMEDYRQRFEETQNNIKIRNTLLGILTTIKEHKTDKSHS